MATLKRFTKESLQILLNDIYQKYGFSKADSQQITEILLQADMAGIPSHGVQRLNYYDGKIKSGQIKVDNQAEVIKETSISAVLDGHSA
ncbi:Ldh family oxidoreductase, partial [Aerococcus urinaeequi]|uniref:Ldh family oxidoreductase n=2 Tax=Aerococcus TaxID=1375 RepID=UPI003D6B82DA